MATGVVAAAIFVWGVVEIGRARIDTRPESNSTEATEDTPVPSSGPVPTATPPDTQPTAAPPGTPLYAEVFSVSDAVFHRGTWFVLDRRAAQVHRISESGSLLGSFGREGEGPGELRRPTSIVSREDTVIVLDGGDLHLFELDGYHLADRRVGLRGCANGSVRDLLSQPTGLLLLVNCLVSGRIEWIVMFEAVDGRSQTLAVRAGDPGVLDMRMASPVLSAHPQGFVFGLVGNDCLDLFGPRGVGLGEVCHDWIERLPIPTEAEDRMVDLRARARQSGMRLVESDFLPPFVQVFPVGGGLAYQVPLPEDLETFRLVTRGPSGEAVALALPVAEGMFAAGNSVLLWWEDLDGTRIAIQDLGVS